METGAKKLTPQELENQFNEIVQFLSSVHPSLLSYDGYRPCIELRPILRQKPVQEDTIPMLMRSLLLWDLEERSLARLRKFLSSHNGQPTCLYYSIFDFNNNIDAVTAKGEKAKTGKITSSSALGTQEIALDFDHIDFEDYVDLVDRFEALGLYAMWVFSGHGWQAHILLDQRMTEKKALQKTVYKFRSKGFSCDPACIDPARVMRLPGTHNYKCLRDESYAHERENPPMCAIVQMTEERYSMEEVFSKLDSLPTVSLQDEEAYIMASSQAEEVSAVAETKPSATKPVKGAEVMKQEDLETIRVSRMEYPYLSEYVLPAPIENMLIETPHGYRNAVLGFLIKHFKNNCKLGKEAILEVLTIWAQNACIPAYDPADFKKDFTRLYYNYNGLGYSAALAEQFGVLDEEQIVRLRKQDIHIPNKFFRDLDKLEGKTVRAYLAIKMLEHFDEETTQEKIADLLNISTRALRPTLQDLVKSGHGYMTKANAKAKIPATYHTSRIVSAHDGYVKFSYNDVNSYVTDLYPDGARGNKGNNELKLYLFMRYKFYSGDIYMSQANLGEHISVTQAAISGIVSRLEERRYLKVRKVFRSNGLMSCEYILLR